MFRRSSALARDFVAVVRELASGVEAKVVSSGKGLHERALANLDGAAASIELSCDEAGVRLASLPGRYTFNATLALSPAVWKQVEHECGAAVCALPERELCLFVPAGDAAAVADLARLAPALFDAAGYPVSRGLYRRDSGGLSAVPVAP